MSNSSPPPEIDTLEALYRLSGTSPERRGWWPAARTLLAVFMLVALALWTVVRAMDEHAVDMLADLPQDGVIAADVGSPHVGGPWVVTSGTLLARDGRLWSGRPDAGPPDPARGRTGSAVLRAISTRRDFEDVHVTVDMALNGLHTTPRTSSQPWDGVHLFLRYRNANELYVVDLARRDGTLAVKRKTAAASASLTSPEATATGADLSDMRLYTTLATTSLVIGEDWHRYDVTISDSADGVTLALAIDGHTLLRTVDPDATALRGPGGVGLRGDNADFQVRGFRIKPQGDEPDG
jgi:hypothetical protein